ncbi:hypothetical protein [Streptomyces sioyaensis]|uniref:hypothetical protein n=1 Tax=Streptomyces sioyaensis TaxID=67364 RepID=UPI0037A4AB49
MQTCRRHPEAGHFMATCSGCTQDLYDIEQRNLAEAAALRAQARQALDILGTSPDAQIISARRHGDALIVATQQPGAFHPVAVDTFRLPTADETDPEQVDPLTPGAWLLIDSRGGHDRTELQAMIRSAKDYLGPVTQPTPEPAAKPERTTINDLRHFVDPVTKATLPATKALAYSYLAIAETAHSHHLKGCQPCYAINGRPCTEGARIARILDEVAECAVDWDELNDCLRGGDREQLLAS